jgi:3-oxoacyl-[acyl-carrier-protein] synthase-1
MKTLDSFFTVHIESDAILNSIGFSTAEVYASMKQLKSGTVAVSDYTLSEPIAMLSQINKERFYSIFNIQGLDQFTFFEQIQIYVIQEALKNTGIDPSQSDLLFVFSTTKGNIHLIDPKFESIEPSAKVFLWNSAQRITNYFKNPNRSITISNACISGTQAIIRGAEIVKSGTYNHVIVIGADCISPFVVSGFQSFKALSDEMCQPFDLKRKGLNIGEGAAAVLLSKNQNTKPQILDGCVTNDANHISGPSRTGEGLFRGLQKVMSGIDINEISFINAHGTATPYNDEMEAIAFERAGLQNIPINSYKAYFGHTLGAAGVMESIISAHALQNDEILASLGFEEIGVTTNINVQGSFGKSNKPICIKTASGFGGCNGVLAIRKGGNYGI